MRLPKTTTRYTPGKWTSGDHAALFVETPRGTWKATAHKDDSTWSVRGPDPDDPLHYADGEVHTADPDVKRGDAEGRYATAKKRARAYIMEQLSSKKSARHATRKKSSAQLDREIAEALAAGPGSSTPFEAAKAERDLLEKEVDASSAALQAFPRGPMGLVSEAVTVTPEYRAAKARFQKAFARQREFNAAFTKRFAKELRAERSRRYGNR